MKKHELFPRPYFQESHFLENGVLLTINRVQLVTEEGTPGAKPAIFFNGDFPYLRLAERLFNPIAELHGGDTDDWAGKDIRLGVETVSLTNRETGEPREVLLLSVGAPQLADGDFDHRQIVENNADGNDSQDKGGKTPAQRVRADIQTRRQAAQVQATASPSDTGEDADPFA